MPAGTPAISIILPVRNEAATLPGSLAALQAQIGADTEIIVVDGGSSDGTLQRVRESGIAVQLLETDPGRARQMNTGAAAARGRILLFLHADTRLPCGALKMIDAALAGDRVWGRFDVRLSGRHWLLRIVEYMMNLRSRLSGIATSDQAIFVRREVFMRLGGYPSLPLMEDIALSRRLKRSARPVCLRARVVTSSRRWEQQGILRTVALMWTLRLAWFLGVPSEYLARIYYPSRKQS